MSSPARGNGGSNAGKGASPSNPKPRPLFPNSSRPSSSPSLPTNQTLFNIPIPVRPNPNPSPSPSSNTTNNPNPVANSRGSGSLYPSNRGGFIPNSKSMEMMEQPQPQRHHSFPVNMNMHMMQMNMNLHHHNLVRPPPPPPSNTAAATIRHLSTHPRFPLAPSSSSVSVPESNGSANDSSNAYKNRERDHDRDRDDALGVCVGVVRDRRVRFSEGASLYSLCRSWLKNGFPEPNQPPYVDTIKSLPRPLPVNVVDASELKKKEADAELEDAEDEENAGDLSSQELLKRHVRRAKRVRSRLREERLQRIARYKLRLALLLPSQTEQLRSDAAAGT